MQIAKGQRVRFSKGTISFIVSVRSANNYGTELEPDWYIEGTRLDNGAPVYCKSRQDGVAVEVV